MRRNKPVSAMQLAANRANARNSTGPRTEALRQTVSLNAVNHGLRGNFGLFPGEDHAVYQTFSRENIHEFAPANAPELNLAQTRANDFWRLARAAAIETNVFASGAIDGDPHGDDNSDTQIGPVGIRTFGAVNICERTSTEQSQKIGPTCGKHKKQAKTPQKWLSFPRNSLNHNQKPPKMALNV